MKTKNLLILLIVTTISAHNLFATSPGNQLKDKEIFNNYISYMGDVSQNSIQEIIIKTAKFFLGTPYVGHTLETEPEALVVNLSELDCTTLVENVLALSRTVIEGDLTFDSFKTNLQTIRYRHGIIEDYADRLHYTTDWIYHNERKGFVENVTAKVGGVEHSVDLFIMSSNPDRYKQLSNKPLLTAKIIGHEKDASKRNNFRIPAAEIEKNSALYRDGDIVCFVTNVKGIDISHVGFIYFEGERLTFIHASSTEKKVVIDKETLQNYSLKSKNNNGIMVVRPL